MLHTRNRRPVTNPSITACTKSCAVVIGTTQHLRILSSSVMRTWPLFPICSHFGRSCNDAYNEFNKSLPTAREQSATRNRVTRVPTRLTALLLLNIGRRTGLSVDRDPPRHRRTNRQCLYYSLSKTFGSFIRRQRYGYTNTPSIGRRATYETQPRMQRWE